MRNRMTKGELKVLADELKVDLEKMEEERMAFNEWSGGAVMWIDFEDGAVWTQVEESSEYEQETIFVLINKSDFYGANDRVSLEKLLKLAKLKQDYYKNGENRLMIESLSVADV